MLNINFVPEDYIQSNECRRTNLMYLVLLLAVMLMLGASFMAIKIRQKALNAKERFANTKMAEAREAIKQFEQLQAKRKLMMRTALTTVDLIEPVPRSVLLATLTNNLPSGVSFSKLKIVQKQPRKRPSRAVAITSKFQKVRAQKTAAAQPVLSKEKFLETHIAIEGIAPSDLEVASYIEQLSNSTLLDNVALVESKEHQTDGVTFRKFKLTAMLIKNPVLPKKI